jgi:hypothetical protein
VPLTEQVEDETKRSSMEKYGQNKEVDKID